MIYDILYKHYLYGRDLGHLKEMILVQRYYQDYFPDENIVINIEYAQNYYPCKCTITTFKGSSVIIETYLKKPWNRETVMCEKCIINNGNVKYYSKINEFTKENVWKEITSNTI
jgi:hypothetical protein